MKIQVLSDLHLEHGGERAVADRPQASTRSESAILPQGWMPVRVAPAPTRSARIPPYPCPNHAPPG